MRYERGTRIEITSDGSHAGTTYKVGDKATIQHDRGDGCIEVDVDGKGYTLLVKGEFKELVLYVGARILITNTGEYNGVDYVNGDLATVIKCDGVLTEAVVDGKGITKFLPHEFELYTDVKTEDVSSIYPKVIVQELPDGFAESVKFLNTNCPEINGCDVMCSKYEMYKGEDMHCDDCWVRHLDEMDVAK
jgi:hypothetical protein